MCQFLCRDKHIELGAKVRGDRKVGGGKEDERKDGSDSYKVSGGPDIPFLPSHA